MRSWFDNGEVQFLAHEGERLVIKVLEIVLASQGALNTNDAPLVALQREGAMGMLATFDKGFEGLADFDYTS
jgi:hypothetical protein